MTQDPKELIGEIRLVGFRSWFVARAGTKQIQELRRRDWKRLERIMHMREIFPLPDGYYWDSDFATRGGTVRQFRMLLMQGTSTGARLLGHASMQKE